MNEELRKEILHKQNEESSSRSNPELFHELKKRITNSSHLYSSV
ncbi:MAG: hypothetical protein AAGF04_05240 [Chlamydiota bacterium]